MNGLIVALNRTKTPYPVPPVGAAMVAEALDRRGYGTRLLDLCFSRNPVATLKRTLNREKPEWVGVSFRNLDNVDSIATESYVPLLREVAGAIRAAQIPFVIGGPGAAVAPEEILTVTGADGVFIGSSEAFARTMAERGMPIGVVTQRGVDTYSPDLIDRWIDIGAYLKYERMIPVRLKQGCAFDCSYCTYAAVEGKGFLYNGQAGLEDYIRSWIGRGAVVDIVDSVFNEPLDRAVASLRKLDAAGLKGRYHISALSPRGVSPELFDAMADVGALTGMIGLDSASDTMLASYNKPFRMAGVDRLMELRGRGPFTFLWSFVVGGPGETERTMDETMRFIERLPAGDMAYITFGVRAYPGTGVYRRALEQAGHGAHDGLEPLFYFSSALDRGRALGRLKEWEKGIDTMILSTTANRPLSSVALRLLTALGVAAPSWRTLARIKPVLRKTGILRFVCG